MSISTNQVFYIQKPCSAFAVLISALLASLIGLALLAIIPGTSEARDVNVGADNVIIKSGEEVEDVSVLNGNVRVDGTVTGSISVLNGNVTLQPDSVVDGDVNIANGNVKVKRAAILGDNANVANGNITVAKGGLIEGEVRLITGNIKAPPETIEGERSKGSDALDLVDVGELADLNINVGFPSWFGITLVALLLSIALAAIFPHLFRAFSVRIGDKPWLSGLVGLSAAFWIPVVLVLLVVTIIGIFLVPLFLSALVVAWFLGWFGFSYFLGSSILRLDFSKRHNVIFAMVLGVAIMRLVDLIPVAGHIVNVVGALFAFGALTLMILNERGQERSVSS